MVPLSLNLPFCPFVSLYSIFSFSALRLLDLVNNCLVSFRFPSLFPSLSLLLRALSRVSLCLSLLSLPVSVSGSVYALSASPSAKFHPNCQGAVVAAAAAMIVKIVVATGGGISGDEVGVMVICVAVLVMKLLVKG